MLLPLSLIQLDHQLDRPDHPIRRIRPPVMEHVWNTLALLQLS